MKNIFSNIIICIGVGLFTFNLFSFRHTIEDRIRTYDRSGREYYFIGHYYYPDINALGIAIGSAVTIAGLLFRNKKGS